jgi:hypothetical protein
MRETERGGPGAGGRGGETRGERWVAHMIVKTLASACLLLEIRWQKGRQADFPCCCFNSLNFFRVLCALD